MSTQPDETPRAAGVSDAIELVIAPRPRDLGGFQVRRVLPCSERRLVGPFIFFDEMGPAEFTPGNGIDVRPHPHINLATVTYLFEGEILHRDSLGCVQSIRPGALNWMTAGRGIVHSERTPPTLRAAGHRVHGIQSWVALPRDREEVEPDFEHVEAGALPVIERAGARLRLIAGSAYGERAPVRVASPMFYLEAHLASGATLALPDEYQERAVYVVDGELTIAGERARPRSMYVLRRDVGITLLAQSPSHVMLLGGAPLDGERHIWWNFVSSSQQRIEQAREDWRAGRFARVPGETEFIPLPP